MTPSAALRSLASMAIMVVAVVCASRAEANPQDDTRPGATQDVAPELANVGIDEHLGGPLPKDAIFRDTSGQMVTLGQYFDGRRPVLLVFAYHSCPMLCSLVLDAVTTSLVKVPWTVGQEFDVVSISIDPRDTPEKASKKRDELVAKYGRVAGGGPGEGSTTGWHFLVGDEQNIRRVTNAIGFDYHWEERQQQYAHPAAAYLITPDAKIARYLYGIEYDPNDVRLGLLEASKGRFISTTEKLLLYCYHYDPQGKKYSLAAMNVMRLGGGVTVLLMGTFLGVMFLRERRKRRASATASTRDASPSDTNSAAPLPHQHAS